MSLFKIFSNSANKSKLIKNLSLILDRQKQGDASQAYQELFDCIKTSPGLSTVVEIYGFTCEEFISLSHRFMAFGYGWQKSDYIPVSVFCFTKPLSYILQNREAFESKQNNQMDENEKRERYNYLLSVLEGSAELLK